MIKKINLLLITLCCCGMTMAAQSVDRVYSSDGSVYEGYISEQIPGERVCVYAQKATLIIPANSVKSIQTVYRPFSVLTDSAKSWIREYEDSTKVAFSLIETTEGIIDDLVVLNKDDKSVECISFANKTYVLPWGSIVKTEKISLPEYPYGIQDIVTLNSGDRYVGFVTEQIIGKSMKIKTEEGDVTVLSEDVIGIKSEAINKDTTIWVQTQLLDRIIIGNGNEVLEGFILSRVMGNKLTILRKDTNVSETVPMINVDKYQKIYNVDYKEYQAPEAAKDTVMKVVVNDAEAVISSTVQSGKYILVQNPDVVTAESGSVIRLEITNAQDTTKVKLYRSTKSKTISEEGQEEQACPAIVIDAAPVQEFDIISEEDGKAVCEIEVIKKGLYFLSISDMESVLVINVN